MDDSKSGEGESDARPATYWERHSDRVLGILALGVLSIGTVVYHLLEGWSWVDSFYFSSVAVTTVGFGDVTPSTDASKLFTVLYIFSGIAIITVWLNMRLTHRAAHIQRKRGFVPDSGNPVLPPDVSPPDPDPTGPLNPRVHVGRVQREDVSREYVACSQRASARTRSPSAVTRS